MSEPGAIIRTKTIREYGRKRTRDEPAGLRLLYQDLKPQKGQHGVVMSLGMIGEDQPIEEEWLFSRFDALGWEPIAGHPMRQHWDEWKAEQSTPDDEDDEIPEIKPADMLPKEL